MPDWPRKDLVGIKVRMCCNKVPGCTLDTPCEECQEILFEGHRAAEGYCESCLPREHDTCGMMWGCPCCELTIEGMTEGSGEILCP